MLVAAGAAPGPARSHRGARSHATPSAAALAFLALLPLLAHARLLHQMPGSSGLGAPTGGLAGMTGWGWGRAFASPLSPLAGNLGNVYCSTSGQAPQPPKSMLFACTRQPANGITSDIIPRFPVGVICANMCAPASPAGAGGACIPCSDPALICAREFGGGLGSAAVWLAEAQGVSTLICPTPGVDGGRAFAGTVPQI